jgi:hypothetical protein
LCKDRQSFVKLFQVVKGCGKLGKVVQNCARMCKVDFFCNVVQSYQGMQSGISKTLEEVSVFNVCSVLTGLGLDTLYISWFQRVSVLTTLKISSLEKSWSLQLLFFEWHRFTVNSLYGRSVLSRFYLLKPFINQELRAHFY